MRRHPVRVERERERERDKGLIIDADRFEAEPVLGCETSRFNFSLSHFPLKTDPLVVSCCRLLTHRTGWKYLSVSYCESVARLLTEYLLPWLYFQPQAYYSIVSSSPKRLKRLLFVLPEVRWSRLARWCAGSGDDHRPSSSPSWHLWWESKAPSSP